VAHDKVPRDQYVGNDRRSAPSGKARSQTSWPDFSRLFSYLAKPLARRWFRAMAWTPRARMAGGFVGVVFALSGRRARRLRFAPKREMVISGCGES